VAAEGFLGPKLEQEALEVIDPVEHREGAGERAGRRREDPAHPRPELALAEPLEEAQLHEDPVDGAAGQYDSDVGALSATSSLSTVD
jgi:hypothetical protein